MSLSIRLQIQIISFIFHKCFTVYGTRERQREVEWGGGERERQRQRQTDRQTDKQTDRQTDRQRQREERKEEEM